MLRERVSKSVMTPSTPTTTVSQRTEDTAGSVRTIVDWLVAALLLLGGLISAVGGYFLFLIANREAIAQAVADGSLQSDVLTPTELVEVTYAVTWWGGLGLAVTSLLLIVAGVGYLAVSTRSRRDAAHGIVTAATGANAIVGAVVTVVTSFVPLSPILGGVVAGYLQRNDRRTGATAGALSGLAVTLPMTVLFGFLVVGLATVSLDIALLAGVVMLIALLVTGIFTVALSALGGYLGVVVGEYRSAADPVADEPR